MSGSGAGRAEKDHVTLAPRRSAEPTSWMNGYGRIRRCFERDGRVIDFYLYLAAAFVTVRALIREAAPATDGTRGPPPDT